MASAGISALNTGEQISSKLMTTKATYLLQSFFMRSLQSTFAFRTRGRKPAGEITVFDNPRIYFGGVRFNAWVPG
jgi:hypothetical protein